MRSVPAFQEQAEKLIYDAVDVGKKTVLFNLRKAGNNALVALTERAVQAIESVPHLPGCPYVFWKPQTETRYQRVNETFNRARVPAGLPRVQLKDFRREVGILLAESGQPLHVAQSQLGHSSIRTTEGFYAQYSPEFAIERARPGLESCGRDLGAAEPVSPALKTAAKSPLQVIDFNEFKRAGGGGERILHFAPVGRCAQAGTGSDFCSLSDG